MPIARKAVPGASSAQRSTSNGPGGFMNYGESHQYTAAPLHDEDQEYPYYPTDGYPDDNGDDTPAPQYGHARRLSQSFFNEAAAALAEDIGGSMQSPPAPYHVATQHQQRGSYYNPEQDNFQSAGADMTTVISNAQPYPTTSTPEPPRPYSEVTYTYEGPQHDNEAVYSQGDVEVTHEPYYPNNDDQGILRGGDEQYDDNYYNEKRSGDRSYDGEYNGDHGDDWEGDEEEAFGGGQMRTLDTQHFGPAPAKGALARRLNAKKRVALTQGNLVLDCPVPSRLQGFLTRKNEEEYDVMRYTAVTCDPEEYPTSGYSLRPQLYDRHTELFIAITLYNEDEVLLCRTLHGVFKNIAHLCSRNKSRTWGVDGWKKVVVCIIADGRKKVHPRVLDCLAALGVYQEGVAKNVVNGKRVEAHLYEYTTQLSIDSNLQFKGAERGLVPVQILLCIKERNQKKINSHKWFFSAFGPLLQPNVCILLDAGTRPEAKSIYYLWKSFDLHSNVAGACGEITADTKGRWGIGKALLNPLVAAQNFEYKMSNILDKPTESLFGYISVLPGAFSAYRYLALQNDEYGRGPLASYFKGENLLGADADVFSSNMYLAEDRILCFELAAKRSERWVLKYVKQARGVTDVPDQLPEFISQRRRWLNGSMFASIYALTHTAQFLDSDHGAVRKTFLMIESLYAFINVCFAWFGVANYYIFFRILTTSLESSTFGIKHISVLNTLVQFVYLGTLVSCFVFALGNRPQGSRWKYMIASIIFAVLTLYMMIAAVICLVHAASNIHDAVYAQMIVSLLATYGVYLISSVIALDPLHLITSFFQYLLLAPTFINILQVYAFANIHDFSWGTKGSDTVSNDLGSVTSKGKDVVEISLPDSQRDIDGAYDEALNNLRTRPMIIKGESGPAEKELARKDYYAGVRTNMLMMWILSNGCLAGIILGSTSTLATFDSGSGSSRTKVYMVLVLVFVAAMSCVRLIASTAFTAMRLVAG